MKQCILNSNPSVPSAKRCRRGASASRVDGALAVQLAAPGPAASVCRMPLCRGEQG